MVVSSMFWSASAGNCHCLDLLRCRYLKRRPRVLLVTLVCSKAQIEASGKIAGLWAELVFPARLSLI